MAAAKILVCMNPFKGTLTNREATEAVAITLRESFQVDAIPIGDGGRGTLHFIKESIGGTLVESQSVNPKNHKLIAQSLLIPNAEVPESAFIEISETCGYHLIHENERDILKATSRGLGIQIRSLLHDYPSIKKLFVCLGDSIISDAGMGMLIELGVQFLDRSGKKLSGNAKELIEISSIQTPASLLARQIPFTVLCDVTNPLCGPKGSAAIFAPQKGATPSQVNQIAAGMENFAKLTKQATKMEIANAAMGGSAGGLASAFSAYLGGTLVGGAAYLFDWLNFNKRIEQCDVLITGEGKMDAQTFSGKAPLECLKRVRELKKKMILIGGKVENEGTGLSMVKEILAIQESGLSPNPYAALQASAKKLIPIISNYLS